MMNYTKRMTGEGSNGIWDRILFTGSAMFLVILATAQQQKHFFAASAPLDEVGVRAMIEAVHDVDPNGRVLHHYDDRSLVQIDVNPSVTETELRESMVRYGIDLLAGTPDIPRDEPVYTTPEGRPLYVVSGDAPADRARYEQAVREWNEKNPNDRIQLPVKASDDE